MDYHVILIEYGKPTHRWVYQDLNFAVKQLHMLLQVFSEVNEITATLIKAGVPEREWTCSQLIQNQIIRPNFDLD